MSRNYGNKFYGKCQNLTILLTRAYDVALAKYDVLVMPTLPFKAPKLPVKDDSVKGIQCICLRQMCAKRVYSVCLSSSNVCKKCVFGVFVFVKCVQKVCIRCVCLRQMCAKSVYSVCLSSSNVCKKCVFGVFVFAKCVQKVCIRCICLRQMCAKSVYSVYLSSSNVCKKCVFGVFVFAKCGKSESVYSVYLSSSNVHI